jgi:hypothetical protein
VGVLRAKRVCPLEWRRKDVRIEMTDVERNKNISFKLIFPSIWSSLPQCLSTNFFYLIFLLCLSVSLQICDSSNLRSMSFCFSLYLSLFPSPLSHSNTEFSFLFSLFLSFSPCLLMSMISVIWIYFHIIMSKHDIKRNSISDSLSFLNFEIYWIKYLILVFI